MLRWLRRNKSYRSTATLDVAELGTAAVPEAEPPVIVDRLTEQELRLLFSAQQLADAGDFVDQGKLSSALALYSQVLTEVPHQPVALAEKGFLEWDAGYQDHQTGVMAKGRSLVAESVQVAPSAPVGHLFLGIIDLDQDKDPASSVAQMSLFLADHPPTALLDQAASVVAAAYRADGKPVPKTLPAPASSSPATSSSAGASASSPSPSTRGTSGGSSGPVGSTTGG